MEWSFEIVDALTAPMKKAEQGLGQFDAKLRQTDAELKKFQRDLALDSAKKEQDPLKQKIAYLQIWKRDQQEAAAHAKEFADQQEKAGFSFGELGQALAPWAMIGTFLIEAGTKVAEVTQRIAELGVEFLKTGLEEARWQQSTELVLTTLLGTKGAAIDAMDYIERLGERSDYAREAAFELYRQFAAFKNLSAKNIEDLTSGVADVTAALGKGAGDAVAEAMRNMQAMGKMDPRVLHELKATGVTTPEKVMQFLAEQHHTSIANIKQMLEQGKISAAEGTQAILALIQKDVDKGGPLGSLAKEKADADPFKQLENLKTRLLDLFHGVDAKPFADAIHKIADFFDPAGERAQKLRAIISDVFDTFGKLANQIAGSKTLGNVFDGLVSGLKKAWTYVSAFINSLESHLQPVLQRFGPMLDKLFGGPDSGPSPEMLAAIDKFAGVLAYTVDNVLSIIAAIERWVAAYDALKAKIDAIEGVLNGLFGGGEAAGGSLVDGLIAGIQAKWAQLEATVDDLSGGLVSKVRDKFGIHSPSKVMAELGGYVGEGFALGVESTPPPDLNDIMPVTPPVPNANGAPMGSAGHQIHLNIEVNVHGGGHEQHAVGDEIADKVRAEVVRAIEGMAFEN